MHQMHLNSLLCVCLHVCHCKVRDWWILINVIETLDTQSIDFCFAPLWMGRSLHALIVSFVIWPLQLIQCVRTRITWWTRRHYCWSIIANEMNEPMQRDALCQWNERILFNSHFNGHDSIFGCLTHDKSMIIILNSVH